MSTDVARLDRIRVENFQSLVKADIELGAFTVIVGPSNSGKSAFLRALRAVVRNVNSPSSVRAGKTLFTASVDFGDHTVSIERGKSHSTYRLNHLDSEEIYTKSGRTVPDDVQNALRLPLPEGPDLVFTSQIDPPFLLSETGSTVAKTLGDLTNVSKLHAAAREANRRRSEASKMQKIREDDAEGCAQQIKEKFSDLGERSRTVKEARARLEEIREKAKQRDLLVKTLTEYDTADAAVTSLRSNIESLPTPADIDALAEEAGELLGRRHALVDLIDGLAKLAQAQDQVGRTIAETLAESEQAEKDYHDALVQEGKCPTCGQVVA